MKTINAPRAISDLCPGHHLCCLYETEEEHRALLAPYLRLGLERGEKVVYIADVHTREAVLQYLTDDGLDPKAYLESKQLVLATPRETYLRDGPFDPDKMIAYLRKTTEHVVAEGYPALRVTGEMTWALGGASGSDRLIEYESKLNDFFPGSKCLAICQYDRRRFDPAVLLDVICSHPTVVVGTELYDNFYYMPPAEFPHRDVPSTTLHYWLENLRARKQAEELDRFFTLSRDMLCIAGFDGYFKQLNPSWEKVLGYSQEELLSVPYIDLVHPEDRDATIAEAQKIASGQETIWFENRYRTKDGSYRWLLWTAAPSTDKGIIYAAARDISVRKEAEEEVRRVNAELAATNEELEAFTYSVSHDLRALLRHIDGFSRLLLEEHGTDLPEGARRYLQRIREGAVRMGRLIDELLSLSRVGRSQLSLKRTGLDSMVEDVLEELKPGAQGRDIQWKISPLPSLRCEPGLLRQVFQNLISNAIKFTRPRPQAVIEVGKQTRNGEPVVFVRDNGVGFDMKHSDKLFGIFQRLHRQEDFEGTGVGLAIVQRIIHKHGGHVWAEAEPGKGAAFFFTLGPPWSTSSAADGPKEEGYGE
jgi:PAS domain S-box-containing protein